MSCRRRSRRLQSVGVFLVLSTYVSAAVQLEQDMPNIGF